MSAFGLNSISVAFAITVLDKERVVSGDGSEEDPYVYEHIGFRLSDRIVSAIDRFVGALSRFLVPGEPGVMNRWLYLYPFVGATDWTHALNLADAPNSGYQGGAGVNSPTYAPTGNFNRYAITWAGAVTHNEFGVTFAGGSGNTNCDCADIYLNPNAWNRKSHGLYIRTNSASTSKDMSASFTEPRNGYSYGQGIHPRFTNGDCITDLCYYAKTGVTTIPNRAQAAAADSLGLFSDNQRGGDPAVTLPHYIYKRGVHIASDYTNEVGMGYGDGIVKAYMVLSGARNIAFCFSTRHTRTLEGTKNMDGTGGTLAGYNSEFYFFVQQLQVALLRAV